jgi:processive 1,2-diacylglycerol beta-glucosyltransferase
VYLLSSIKIVLEKSRYLSIIEWIMKILVLAVPVGTGHMKAAKAIMQALKKVAPTATIRFENCFDWVYPLYGQVYTRIYDFAQKKALGLIKFFYGGIGVESGSSEFMYKYHKILADRFSDLLREYQPDYVLCTHFSSGYFSALSKKDFGYKLGIVVTDYYVHPHWVNKEIDHYFIPHESLTEQIMSYGAKREQVCPFGIPIGLELEAGIDRAAARKRFGLSKNRISATIMGSRVFGGDWFEVTRELVDFDYDFLVLCGDNKEAAGKISRLKGKSNLKVLGMVERIHELIGTTDILITKAGGITSTEAAQAAPVLLFANSIVGLEDKNEDFFIGHGAALRITKDTAQQVMADLLSNSSKMAQMRRNLKHIGKKKTAVNIARTVLGRAVR